MWIEIEDLEQIVECVKQMYPTMRPDGTPHTLANFQGSYDLSVVSGSDGRKWLNIDKTLKAGV